ncbi:exodeoxyribonuclease V subunit beta [Vibrio astriarenae]|uniref:RecBCD enzyme subunit RecB n=1 Tax=Vibrio astriarenae TaxID=1481923 RepID=A0A7Z2T1G9_9VIBR|nr:exodeoxyribonuclease V subunit beta [Vibrio astriarenae]QIA62623.1 exodeoxyribonuclease V subunit beta [Vibrio astriarenae]
MTNAAQGVTPLNAMTFPLHGARLIEASAGTGKTFTIAGLYLRLILGHGDEQTRHQQPLTVDQILVVTFTEAATAELRDRIRARIHDARLAFSRGVSGDPVIQPLLDEVEDHSSAVALLLQAERQMDEAAVYTIHGFCQRMLTQNAFESGSRFNNEFVTDEGMLKAQVVADYWRTQFYGLPLPLAQQVRLLWSDPSALLGDISHYLSGAPLKLSVEPMTGGLDKLHQQNLARIDALKQQWQSAQQDYQALIEGSGVNKRSYTKKSLPTWLAAIDAWAANPTTDYSYPDQLEKFSQQVLVEKSPKGNPPEHGTFAAIDEFLAQPTSLKAPILAHAIEVCREKLQQAKHRKQWLSFDDLLTQLSASMDMDEEGLLGERIRTLYPIAMIDEFQDTDPLQYSIFGRIYLDHPDCGLFMIGDPKQAIYGFRGADIFTYIKARNQVSAHYTLGTNWRSSADMVLSVNQIFELPDSPFIYDRDIPFLPVNYSPNADKRHWTLEGDQQPALIYWQQQPEDDKPLSKGEYLDVMASATASEIQKILTASDNGNAELVSGDKRHAIQAGDVAVLVRTGAEGQRIQRALADQGIASVYLSNRDSVFSSAVAMDILRLLTAVLTPDDERKVKAALSSRLFDLPIAYLEQLNEDENEWEAVLIEFKDYQQQWFNRGVLPMLRAVLSQRHLAERWLHSESERQLTDFMHLSELLQNAGAELDSHQALLRWLSQAISDAQQGVNGGDDAIQRLESERNLVQIVTIHKSKGLEYDLVFLPFVFAAREASEAKYYDAEQDRTVLDILANDDALALADKERLAEDLRLIYVALTRAVYACYIGAAPLRNGRSTKEPTGVHKSAMGYLLQNGQQGGMADLANAIGEQTKLASVAELSPPECLPSKYVPPTVEQDDIVAQTLTQNIDRHWRMTSYSGLVKQGSHGHKEVLVDVGTFDVDSADEAQQDDEEQALSIFNFPRGAQPGTFLHALFEEVEYTQLATEARNTAIILDLMKQSSIDEQWLPVLQNMVDTVLATPLDGQQMRLKDSKPSQRLVEMEFMLPIKLLSAPALNRVIKHHDSLSARTGDLGFQTVQGMLKGFIDLVFEYQGKYYVLDWKSNHLGDQIDDYHSAALSHSMADHRYDLQYQIYSLALHRFLNSRIPNYDYEHHFGGVYYVFLRGVDGQSDNGIFSAKPSLAMLNDLNDLIDDSLESSSLEESK